MKPLGTPARLLTTSRRPVCVPFTEGLWVGADFGRFLHRCRA